jgi:hypothetical protein
VTNHAVVAIIEDQVKHTRCSTCDAEHEYRQGKAPAPRKPKSRGLPPEGGRPSLAPRPPSPVAAEPMDAAAPSPVPLPVEPPQALVAAPRDDAPGASAESAGEPEPLVDDDGPVHRPLIRATFPRPEGQVPTWREPEFTIRQPTGHRGRGQGPAGYGGHRSAGGRGFGGGDSSWGRGGGQGRGGPRGGGQRHGGGFGRGPQHGGGPGRKGGR